MPLQSRGRLCRASSFGFWSWLIISGWLQLPLGCCCLARPPPRFPASPGDLSYLLDPCVCCQSIGLISIGAVTSAPPATLNFGARLGRLNLCTPPPPPPPALSCSFSCVCVISSGLMAARVSFYCFSPSLRLHAGRSLFPVGSPGLFPYARWLLGDQRTRVDVSGRVSLTPASLLVMQVKVSISSVVFNIIFAHQPCWFFIYSFNLLLHSFVCST